MLWTEILEDRTAWVNGHAGNPEIERCDELAVMAASGDNHDTDINYEKGITKEVI